MIDIVLATYNGAAHLRAQLDSLLQQEQADWRLLVRDDGSTDATAEILADYARRCPERISLLPHDGRRLGGCGNFAELMAHASADYVMLCDQDDVWLPEKIRVTLAEMRRLEELHGQEAPLLVHSDCAVVDGELKPLSSSLWRLQGGQPRRCALNQLLVQNVVTGCTAMVNRALLERALPIPAGALMHDWWLALVTAAFGKIGALSRPTMLYRQHGGNQIGAQRWDLRYLVGLLGQRDVIHEVLARDRRQAQAFSDHFGEALSPGQRALLEDFIHLPEYGKLRRWHAILGHRIFFAGLGRNLGWLVLC